MALLGSSVDPRLFMQDYSGFTRAAEIQAQGMQNLGAAIVQGIKDFGEARQERKKLDAQIKADSASIESAIKLGDSLGIDVKSYLAPIQEKINDPNTTPMEAAAYGRAAAQGISNAFTLGIGAQERQSAQQRAMIEQQYRMADLAIKGERADIARMQAEKGPAPKFEMRRPTITSPTGEVFEGPELPYDESRGMYFDPKVKKYIADPNLIGTGKEYAPDSVMPTPTSQIEIIAPSTAYSFGKAVGGPDELQDKWTNKGYTSTGPNLIEGVVAVNTKKYPLGTVFKDNNSGNVYIAADKHGNKDASVIDFFQNPENYTAQKINKSLSIIDKIPQKDIPKTKYGMSQLISKYSGDMTKQAMGTPEQQGMSARQIEEGQQLGLSTAQNIPQGALPTEPSMITQQPQLPQQSAPQWTPPPGFAPKRGKFRDATAEEIARYGTQGQVNLETGEFRPIRPPSGMVIEQTPEGGFRVVQGAGVGGRQEQVQKAQQEQKISRSIMGTQEIGRALEVLDSGVMQGSGPLASFYRAGASKFIKGTPEYKLANEFIAPIKSMLAFDELNKMRAASPTGGALGNVAKFETDMLQQTAGQLDIDKADPKTIRENLMRLSEKYLDAVHGTIQDREKLLRDNKISKETFLEILSLYPAFTMGTKGEMTPRQVPQIGGGPEDNENARIEAILRQHGVIPK